MINPRDTLLLLALTVLALLLSLLPLPEPALPLRPAWPLIVLSAWALQRDPTAVLPLALVAGLILDATRGVPLGVHAIALLLPLAALLQWRVLMRALPLWQSTLGAGLLFLLQALLMTLLDLINGEHSLYRAHWWPIPVSMLLWPLAVLLLRPAPASKSPD